MRRTGGAAILGLAATTGCAAAPSLPLPDDPALAAVRAAGPPLPLRVAVATPSLAAGPPTGPAGLLPWTADEWQAAVVEAVSAAGVARRVRAAEAGPDPLAAAWDAGDDLLLALEVRSAEVRYAGINGWFWPNVTGFLLFGVWPTWWIADEDYTVTLEALATLRSTASGREVWRATVTAEVTESLSDFERGLVMLGSVRVPSALDATNWRAVAAALGPAARRRWQVALATRLSAGLRAAADTPRFRADTRQTLAVVVGCGEYFDARLPNLKFPAEDARAVAEWLRRAGAQPRQVRLLTDAAATRAAVLDALTTFVAPHARAGDRVVVYFAGYAGADGVGGVALLPYDADPAHPGATALPLRTLATALAAIPGADCLCVIDAGLGGGAGGRWLAAGGAAPARERLVADLDALLARPRTAVCWGCEWGEGAADADPALRRGLWTLNWLRAANRARDRDGDGVVSAQEAFAQAREAVQTIGILTGQAQEPRLYGEGAAATLPVPRATGAAAGAREGP